MPSPVTSGCVFECACAQSWCCTLQQKALHAGLNAEQHNIHSQTTSPLFVLPKGTHHPNGLCLTTRTQPGLLADWTPHRSLNEHTHCHTKAATTLSWRLAVRRERGGARGGGGENSGGQRRAGVHLQRAGMQIINSFDGEGQTELSWRTPPPLPRARTTVKALKMTETTPPVVLTMAVFTHTVKRRQQQSKASLRHRQPRPLGGVGGGASRVLKFRSLLSLIAAYCSSPWLIEGSVPVAPSPTPTTLAPALLGELNRLWEEKR